VPPVGVLSLARGESHRELHTSRPAHGVSDVVSRRRRDDDDAPATEHVAARTALLSEDELRAIESTYEDGITAVQIVDVFASRGIRLSEASFRKYVQQGLLPRSRRIGRKGKHRGSLGVYPAKTVRRINAVKRLMADGHTIEEIQGEFLLYTDLIEAVVEALADLGTRLEREIGQLPDDERRRLELELAQLRRDSASLSGRLSELTRRLTAPRTEKTRRSGAAGSAEDLL
jgi:hypothetical protein